MKTSDFRHARRAFLRRGATIAAAFPFLALPRKAAAADTLTLLAWYGNGEPDVVGAFEEANNVKIESKYYTGGDNMLALLAQSPTGTYDVICPTPSMSLSCAAPTTSQNSIRMIIRLTISSPSFAVFLCRDFGMAAIFTRCRFRSDFWA